MALITLPYCQNITLPYCQTERMRLEGTTINFYCL